MRRLRFYADRAARTALARVRRSASVDAGEPPPDDSWVRMDGSAPGPRSPHGARILYVDDRVPHPHLGRGYPRSQRIVCGLVELGHAVTLYPLLTPASGEDDPEADIPAEVEVVAGGTAAFGPFWRRRRSAYDVVIVSRPHNKAVVNAVLRETGDDHHAPLVYDAEAIYSLRELAWLRLRGQDPPPRHTRHLIANEVELVSPSAAVVAVSAREADLFAEHGVGPVYVLGHAVAPCPTPAPRVVRRGFLFVGAAAPDSPNVDAARWLCREVFPAVQARLAKQATLRMAGADLDQHIDVTGRAGVEVLGYVDDLTDLYDQARVFVAPIRFSAGIPIKVYEAAAHGVPVVATSLLAEQLGWRHEVDLLVADDAPGFARQCVRLHEEPALWSTLRANALSRVAAECSPVAFRLTLAQIMGQVLRRGTTTLEAT